MCVCVCMCVSLPTDMTKHPTIYPRFINYKHTTSCGVYATRCPPLSFAIKYMPTETYLTINKTALI